jgi:hypothetical protein
MDAKLVENWRGLWKSYSVQILALIGIVAGLDLTVLDGLIDPRLYLALSALGAFARHVNQHGSAGLLQAVVSLVAALKSAKKPTQEKSP